MTARRAVCAVFWVVFAAVCGLAAAHPAVAMVVGGSATLYVARTHHTRRTA